MRKPAVEKVEAEIQLEKAESLGRTGERLEQVLAEVRTLRDSLRSLADGRRNEAGEVSGVSAEIQEALARHARLCALAREIRYQLVVQREAVGCRRHEDVDRHYPMPAPLTLAMLVA